jgi:hypothetical protein
MYRRRSHVNADNVQSGDTCASIDTKYTIAYSDFLRWNPEITTTCTSTSRSTGSASSADRVLQTSAFLPIA